MRSDCVSLESHVVNILEVGVGNVLVLVAVASTTTVGAIIFVFVVHSSSSIHVVVPALCWSLSTTGA